MFIVKIQIMEINKEEKNRLKSHHPERAIVHQQFSEALWASVWLCSARPSFHAHRMHVLVPREPFVFY